MPKWPPLEAAPIVAKVYESSFPLSPLESSRFPNPLTPCSPMTIPDKTVCNGRMVRHFLLISSLRKGRGAAS